MSALPWTLFHEPWWLDAAAPGGWQEITVEDGGQVVARLPFVLRRRFGFTAIGMPPLTRTLGPQVVGQDSDVPPDVRRRMEIVAALFAKLPRHDYFFQICGPGRHDLLACQTLGYDGCLRHTFRIPAGTPLDESWRLTRATTRAAIRKAAARFEVDTALPIDEFSKFYDWAIAEKHGPEMCGAARKQLKHRLYAAVEQRGAGQLLGTRDPDTGELLAAAMVVWGHGTMYYLLTCRSARAASGAVALLVWETIRLASRLGLTYDFDGYNKVSAVPFLSSFGGHIANRMVLRRASRLVRLGLALRG